MSMNSTYRNAVADHGGSLITHMGIVDETGTEITGGDPAYERLAVTWADAVDGTLRPAADVGPFNIPADTTVGGWRGFSAVSGGTSYGGPDIPVAEQEHFTNQGTATIKAAESGILHQTPSE